MTMAQIPEMPFTAVFVLFVRKFMALGYTETEALHIVIVTLAETYVGKVRPDAH